jgi:hypothetical protein
MRRIFLAFSLLALAPSAQAQDARAPTAAAELRQICQADRRRLWGADLCGPFIVVDPATRAVWANQADTGGVLTPSGDGFTGVLPQGVTVANTSVEWSGVRWIMVIAPLPEDAAQRRVLVAHEAWHRVQGDIGLAAQGSENAHLETERGRTLMRLELRALRQAMQSRGVSRWSAARDALTFRSNRLAAFSGAIAQENALDRNEGLAAYTGVKLGAADNPHAFAAATLARYDNHQAFARAYAYASGPAYGLLLDERRRNWRRELGERAPADLLAEELLSGTSNQTLSRALQTHGAAAVAAEEAQRAAAQRTRNAELRARFEGPRLELPLTSAQMEFDPNQVVPVEDLGTVYGVLTVRDVWGEVRATQGALISSDFTRLTVAAPAADSLSGSGWTLRLNPGFAVMGPDGQGVARVAPTS